MIRLQKYLSEQGVCSRRQAEELINYGKISVNGRLAELGMKIDPEKDEIRFKGKIIKPVTIQNIYIILNKPIGYICSNSAKQGKTIFQLLKAKHYFGDGEPPHLDRLNIVGRLDKDSCGLTFLTNDGELTNILTHPRYEHEKEYEIILGETFQPEDKRTLEKGFSSYQGVRFTLIDNNLVRIILKEGQNRQIKKMFGRLGYSLQNLRRIRLNKLRLSNLPEGCWCEVEKSEVV
jgi:23S rRNA pseudouridine2605 synthase